MKRWITSLLVQVFVCALISMRALAGATEDCPREPGIWLSRSAANACAGKCQQRLTESLRRITGLPQLRFAQNGALQVGERSDFTGGSASARAVLFRALDEGAVFVVEDHSGSVEVNFGQIDEGLVYEDCRKGQRLMIWRIRVDFADFKRVDAPRQVLVAFDEGFACLHELLHGLGYQDSARPDEVGEVEELLNQVRTELGLPLRVQYNAEAVQIYQRVFYVRLQFKDAPPVSRATGKGARARLYQLRFLPELGSDIHLAEKQITAHAYWRR